MIWKIEESRNVLKQVSKIPRNILREYEAWKTLVEASGPMALRIIPGYRDHRLKGEWAGARSSYLNKQWRVIYIIDDSGIRILVLEVNPHDYRKKN